MKYKDDLINKKNSEKGFITMLILAIFMVISLFFLSLYSIAVSDYLKAGDGITKISESNLEDNLVESIASNYKKDMLNDIDYDEQKLLYSFDANYEKFFYNEYKNYKYEYIQKIEDGKDLKIPYCVDIKNLTEREEKELNNECEPPAKLGSFGRFSWLEFKNYSSEEDDSRIYTFLDNWREDKSLKNDDYYYDGKLLVRVPIYIKIDFGNGVNSVNLTVGNEFESKDYNFINRPNSSNIFKLESIPYSSDNIILTSEDDLSNTKISLLRKRVIDVEVYTINKFEEKQVKKLTKSINIELGKNNNYIYSD